MESPSQPMKRYNVGKHLSLACGLALVLYFCGFHLIEHFRNVKGPWRVSFRADDGGHPSISISQQRLNISNVTFIFQGERIKQSNTEATVVFDEPKTNVPFGKVVFFDTTFLPGTVTFELFGHEIELLPRTLVINFKEVPWKSGTTFQLSDKDKPGRR